MSTTPGNTNGWGLMKPKPKPATAPVSDFRVDDHGSILILVALTPEAEDWVQEHLPEDRQTWGTNGTVVEHRYIGDIVAGIQQDGLRVRVQ